MATAINFPDNPAVNDTYTYGDITFKFNGTNWFVLTTGTIPLSQGKVLVGDASNKASEVNWSDKADTSHFHSIDYANVDTKLKSKASVTATIDLAANGIGERTLIANTSFAFTNYELNKEYLLIITANGYTPSFASAARHIILAGSADFETTGVFYVSLRCIDATSGAEKLLTAIGISA